MQMAIGEAFTALARRESVRIPFIESVRPDTRVNKKFRIRTNIQRGAPYGKLFIPPESYELVSEWKGFPNRRTIDLLDVLAYGIAMLNIPGGLFAEDYNASVEKAMEESREAPREVFDGAAVDEEYYMLPPPPETLEERMIRVNQRAEEDAMKTYGEQPAKPEQKETILWAKYQNPKSQSLIPFRQAVLEG